MNWRALRIAVVGPLPPAAGGMAGQTQQLAELLRGEGADVLLVQTNAPYRPRWVERVRGLRALFRLMSYTIRLWQAAANVQLFHVMANSGWSWHLFAVPAIIVGRLRGVRVVVSYRGGEAMSFLDQSARWVRPSLAAASALIVPSAFLEQVFGKHGFLATVVPNVVDLSRFRPRDSGEADVTAGPMVLVARSLEPIYDNGTALRAFARVLEQVPRARMVIAGTGPDAARLGALAGSLGISDRVSFAGRLGRDEIAAVYRDASLLLNPSRVDNMPNSVLEALASGVPVVSTDVGGVPYIVSHDRTALLVRAGDYELMATTIVRVLTDPQLATRLATNGLVDVQRYAWPRVRETLGAVYQSLLIADDARVNAA